MFLMAGSLQAKILITTTVTHLPLKRGKIDSLQNILTIVWLLFCKYGKRARKKVRHVTDVYKHRPYQRDTL